MVALTHNRIGYLPFVEHALKRSIGTTELWIVLTDDINEKAYEIVCLIADLLS